MLEEGMKNICLINGSLRGKKAASLEFLNDVNRRLPDNEYNKTFVTVKTRVKTDYLECSLKRLASADAIIFVFPLYTYGLPGALMRLLEDYYQYIKTGKYNKEANVYVIINCAYPRPEKTTEEALRVIKNFCRKLSLKWRFAICIGTGPVVAMTKKVPFLDLKLKKVYAEIASDMMSGDKEVKNDYLIKPVIPASIIAMIKRHYEEHHKLKISDEALNSAVILASRYISDRFLPEKAIDLIDEAASRVRIQKGNSLTILKETKRQAEIIRKEKETALAQQQYDHAAEKRQEEVQIEEKIKVLEKERKDKESQDKLVVTDEDVATIVSMWTGIPVTQLDNKKEK
jgi:hypothetical protein